MIERGRKCGADTAGDRCLARHASTMSKRVAEKRDLQWPLPMESARIVEPVFVGIVDCVLARLVTMHRRCHRDSSENRKHVSVGSRDHKLVASRHSRYGVNALSAEVAHDCDSRPKVYRPAGLPCRIRPDLTVAHPTADSVWELRENEKPRSGNETTGFQSVKLFPSFPALSKRSSEPVVSKNTNELKTGAPGRFG